MKIKHLKTKTTIELTPEETNQWIETINTFDSQMLDNDWKSKNRYNQKKYWLHLKAKEELGNKKYNTLLADGKLQILEKELQEWKPISQLIESL